MTDDPNTDREEQRLRAVLRGLDADAPAPDRSVLDALREQTLKLFDEAVANDSEDSLKSLTPSTHLKKTRNPMMTLAIRGLVAVAGLAAALVVGLNVSNRNHSVAATPFSEVLKNLRGQQTLELQVTKEGKSAEVWVRAPGSVRWQDSPEKYKIAVGSRLWKIDAAANTVTTGDSPWFIDPKRQVDLLGLLEIGVRESAPLLAAQAGRNSPNTMGTSAMSIASICARRWPGASVRLCRCRDEAVRRHRRAAGRWSGRWPAVGRNAAGGDECSGG